MFKKLFWGVGLFISIIFFAPRGVAAMSATSVVPGNLIQSNTTTVTANFTTAVTLPATGVIKVIFPSGFNVSNASGGACAAINGGLATIVSGQTVTLNRDGTGTAVLAGALSCTINNIVNPATIGAAGVYTIRITNSSLITLDEDTNVVSSTITVPATMTVSSIVPENLVALTKQNYTISFTTINSIQKAGKIVITFPAGFNVSGANNGTCAGVTGGFSTAVSGQAVTISRDGTGTLQAAGARTCTLSNIIAPNIGSGGTYMIATQDNNGVATDINSTVAANTFIAVQSLTPASVTPTSLVAGATTNATVSFTTPVTVPIGAKVRVTFPAGFNLNSVSAATCASFTGTMTYAISGNVVTISRTGNGATFAAGAAACTITGIINPKISGATGTYSIEVLDNQVTPASIANNLAVAFSTITAGALGAVSVQSETLAVGATSLNTIKFTLANPWPKDGKVKITYPAGFDVSQAANASCAVVDGTFATSVSGQVVTIARSGTADLAAGALIQCYLSKIKNPAAAGAGGAYNISTYTNADVLIDSGAPASNTFAALAVLTATNVAPATLVAATYDDNVITFTTPQNIPLDAKIKITYPAGFDVSGATGGACTGFDGTLTTSVSGQTITLARGGGGTTSISGAKTCRIYGIKNTATLGVTGTFSIIITDATDTNISLATAAAAKTITVAGTLTVPSVQPAFLSAGYTGAVTVYFNTAVGIPYNGKIKITFPAGFDLSPFTSGSCSTLAGALTASRSGNIITLARNGDGVGFVSGAVICNLSNIKNPTAIGSTGTYTIAVTDVSDTLIATAAAAASTITNGLINSVSFNPNLSVVNADTSAAINFTLTNPLPANGKIIIGFPTGFNLSLINSSSLSCSTLDGTLSAAVAGQTLTAVRSGGTATSNNAAQTCTLNKIINPATVGTAGAYLIETTTVADVIIDQNSAVSGNTFTSAGTISAASIVPDLLVSGLDTAAAINFTNTNPIPADGKIIFIFPSGFNLTSVNASSLSCSSINGTLSTSVTGQTITVIRSGGTAISGGSVQSCRLTNIINPAALGATGAYTIRTLTSLNAAIDENTAVAASTITSAGAITSAGVTPASLTTSATGNNTVAFTTINKLPGDGKIRIVFPSGFNIASASSPVCAAIDGALSLNVSGQTLTISRSGGSLLSPASYSCTISNITNPASAGVSGTYDLSTLSHASNLIDEDAAVSGNTLYHSPSVPGIPQAVISANLASQVWSWTASADTGSGGVNYDWWVDGGPSGTTAATTVTTSLTVGNWKFHVKAVDNAGDESAAQSALIALLSSSGSQVVIDNSVPAVWVVTPDNVSSPVLDLSSITAPAGALLSANINSEIHLKTLLSSGAVTVDIPTGTTIKGSSSTWTKVIVPPTVITPPTALLPTAPSGFSNQISLSVLIGHSVATLDITRGVKILLSGQTGEKVGFISNNVFTEITNTCADDSQATGDALGAGQDCKIDSGSDLVIWTKHFSEFVTYNLVQNPPAGGGGGGGGGGFIPLPLPTNLSVKINNGGQQTVSSDVVVNLGADNAASILISNYADFLGSNWETYVPAKNWTLLPGPGDRTVYVKFRGNGGEVQTVFSATINVAAATTTAATTTAATTRKIGDANGDNQVDELDFSILMSQWGEAGSGLSGDFNNDGAVDELDFSILMAYWGS